MKVVKGMPAVNKEAPAVI